MIYTSYFAKEKKIRSLGYIPISITCKPPKWWTGLSFDLVGPPKDLLEGYKSGNISQEEYTKIYNKYLEDNKDLILSTIKSTYIRDDITIVFVCYEKAGSFCHRHLLSDFLNKNNIECKELSF